MTESTHNWIIVGSPCIIEQCTKCTLVRSYHLTHIRHQSHPGNRGVIVEIDQKIEYSIPDGTVIDSPPDRSPSCSVWQRRLKNNE